MRPPFARTTVNKPLRCSGNILLKQGVALELEFVEAAHATKDLNPKPTVAALTGIRALQVPLPFAPVECWVRSRHQIFLLCASSGDKVCVPKAIVVCSDGKADAVYHVANAGGVSSVLAEPATADNVLSSGNRIMEAQEC